MTHERMENAYARLLLGPALILLLGSAVCAQDPVNCYRFQRTITRGENAFNGGVCLFKDSSYYCFYQPDTNLATEVSVMDKAGNVQFKRQVKRAVPDTGYTYQPKQILRNSDSTVILLNNYDWTSNGIDSYCSLQITCLSDDGDVVWHHEYRDPGFMLRPQRMALDSTTGDILVCGLTYTYMPQNLFLLRFDASGELLWAKRYNSEVYQLMSMVTDAWHALYLGYHNEAHDFEVLKLGMDGIPIWNRKYISPYITTNYSAAYSRFTHRLAFSCLHNHTSSVIYDTINPLVIDVDTSGAVIFAKHYRTSYHKSAVSIAATADSGWVFSLDSNHPSHVNGGLMKVDATGDPVWGHMYQTGSQCNYWSDALFLTPDGGTVHACDYWQNPKRRSLLIKSDREGHTSCSSENPLTFVTNDLFFTEAHTAVSVLDAPWPLIATQPTMVSVPIELPEAYLCMDTVQYIDDVSTALEPAPALSGVVVRNMPGEPLLISMPRAGTASLFGADGRFIRSYNLRAGDQAIALGDLATDICLLRVVDGPYTRVWRVMP